MDTLPIILIAAAVAAVAWAIIHIATGGDGSKKKLQQRLTTNGRPQTAAGGAQPAIRLLDDGSDLGRLAKIPTAQMLRAKLSQAFPSLSLRTFLIICLFLGGTAAFVSW